jgi:hypothetical protein
MGQGLADMDFAAVKKVFERISDSYSGASQGQSAQEEGKKLDPQKL